MDAHDPSSNAPDDKAQPPTPAPVPAAPSPPQTPLNPFTEAATESTAPLLVPVFGAAFEEVECADDDASQTFDPRLIKFVEGESRPVLPLLAWSKPVGVHWYSADDFPNACLCCWSKERGCVFCRGGRKPQIEVFVPVIDLGPRLPGYLKMEKRGGRAHSSKDGGGQALYAQINLFRQGNHPATTGLRITKLETGMYAVTTVNLDASFLPPQALIDRFTAHLAQPLTEILSGFVRFDQPADLMQVPSIKRLVDLGEQG